MSWSRFDKLSNNEQRKVLRYVFLHTGLMYTTNTKKSYEALKSEYHSFKSVKAWVNEAMEEVL